MLLKDATNTIMGKYPDMVIIECLDFPDFFAFALVEKGKENEPFGGGYDTVNKINGEISTFNPTDDLPLYLNAKSIDIKQIK